MKFYKESIFGFFCFVLIAFSIAQTTDSTSYYTSVHYKGSAVIGNSEDFQGCQYNVVSVVDSFLYIQLHFAGIEAGRVLITPDSILFINKLQKKFFKGDYAVFEKVLNMEMDFYTIQAIFTGNPTNIPEESELDYERDFSSYPYPFFRMLNCEYHEFSLRLNVKKVTFNAVPTINAIVPKNYEAIEL
jgi:hypothetical protein